MTQEELYEIIINDLGANFVIGDEIILLTHLKQVIRDALRISNRIVLAKTEEGMMEQLEALSSVIIHATKQRYLRRGTETYETQRTGNNVALLYEDITEKMLEDIKIQNLRRMF